MKRIILLSILLGGWGLNSAQADVIYVQGDVSGTWSADTVIVTGEVCVPPDSTLIIEPGVKVLFQGYFKFIVDQNATLVSAGTPSNWIRFDSVNPWTEWHGFHFQGASSTSCLEYCWIRKGRASGSPFQNCGGGMFLDDADIAIQNCRIEECEADGDGGAIFCHSGAPVIVNNLFTNNTASYNGGAIFVGGATPVITNNIFIQNSALWEYGGAVSCWGIFELMIRNNIFWENTAGNPIIGGSGGAIACTGNSSDISGNLIVSNEATWTGGGIFCQSSASVLEHNLIYGNSTIGNGVGRGGGIGCDELEHMTILHNVICANTASIDVGGIWAGDCLRLTLNGNTIAYNSAPGPTGGIFGAYRTVMVNNIIWGNTSGQIYQSGLTRVFATYCDVQGTWPGLGNINEYPAFVDTAQGDYRLLWGSPCIDSGNPDPQYNDPDGTIADMGSFYYDQSMPVRILLTPHEIPYLIEPEGGSMDYTIRADNIDSAAHTITVWCDVTLPDSTVYGPVLGPVDVTIGPSATLSRIRTQNVPAAAPMGVYHYNAYAVMGADISKDSFMWGKLGSGGLGLGSGGWNNYGEPITDVAASPDQRTTPIHPSSFRLHPCSPNPFNPTTTIRFDLPQAGWVKLEVFDVAGRAVGAGWKPGTTSALVDGWREAGSHEVTFDASDLSSGIYIYRLKAGEFEASGKMVLMK